MVHNLISSYGLLKHFEIKNAKPCSKDDLLIFHSSDYIDHLSAHNEESPEDVTDEQLEFGLGYDCPVIDRTYDYIKFVAGGTICAVNELLNGSEIAINWTGGWHHAQRDGAEGFCYVNDIVIGIQKLRPKFPKILYIDLDIHHGNGVENAFSFSKNIYTLSFHLREPGYFPGSGDHKDIGFGNGRGFCVNAPYKRNITGKMFIPYFRKIAELVYKTFEPNLCVVQCGGDVIVGDKLGGTNLIPSDLLECLSLILNWKIPKLFLGGGGYNLENTARYWTQVTALICGQNICEDIPDNEYFLNYGPDYTLNVVRKNLADENSLEDLETIYRYISG